MSFLMISFIIAINIHVHAVSDYNGEAWQPIDSCRPNHGKPISHAPRPPYIIEGTEKVPFFYDQNGKCLRFVTSLSANRLK